MANETNSVNGGIRHQNNADASSKDNKLSQDSGVEDSAKAIGVPLAVFVLICILIFVLKLKYSKRKVGVVTSENERAKLELQQNPLDLRFKSLIGRGSFGVVWKASINDNIVAVKMCSIDQRERWEKEKEVLTVVENHPNIVKMVDYEVRRLRGEIALTIVLEFVDSGNLRIYLMENQLSIEKALIFLKSLYDGLRFLHSRKDLKNKRKKLIAHRDIKSSNILVSSLRGCVIADFGLALAVDEGEPLSSEHAKAKVGTSRYMAPEKLNGLADDSISWQALSLIDIYAASLVTYEIMTRCCFEFDCIKNGYYEATEYKLPFSDQVGLQPSNNDIKKLVVDDNIRPPIPEEWNNNTATSRLKDLIVRCWDDHPKKRKSAEQMFKEIKLIFLNHELEPNCNNMYDVGQFTEKDNLLTDNDAVIEMNKISY